MEFGAFVRLEAGVEGLVHISELAQQHVENPREIVAPGDEVKVKILEIDSERRRLSLSIKRVEGQVLPRKTDGLGDAGDLEDMPELGLSEDVFAEHGTVEDSTPESEEAEAAIVDAPVDEDVPVIEAELVVDAPVEDVEADAVVEAPDAPAAGEAPAPADEPAAEAESEKE
jgi:small subunit ribosomal protein S1